MKAVRIAELKSRLSQHIHEVRRGGTVTVMDRSTPVARIIPFDSSGDVVITKPALHATPIGRWRPPPKVARLSRLDALDFLRAERQSHR